MVTCCYRKLINKLNQEKHVRTSVTENDHLLTNQVQEFNSSVDYKAHTMYIVNLTFPH